MNRRFCVAPMLDWTDRHCRYFMRLMSQHALLYTEMITTGALIHGPREQLLRFDSTEQPVAIQLGGSDPSELARCAIMAEQAGYNEINLNVGCPSDRVQSGKFGACLMAEPELVRDCMTAMIEAVNIPVTIKSRIGIDRNDSFDELTQFVDTVRQSGCKTFVIHARKAWLDGLSPKQNRDIPPLHYDRVYGIKSLFPDCEIIINGGINTLEDALLHLHQVDGVMLGRQIYHNPYVLSQVDRMFYNQQSELIERGQVIHQMQPYIEQHIAEGGKLQHISRHMIGLYQAVPGAKIWRRYLSQHAHKNGADFSVIAEAYELVQQEQSRISDKTQDLVSEKH